MALSRPAGSPAIVRADCLASDDVGGCVYATGDPVAGAYQVETVDPTTWAKMPAVGVIISKSTATDCVIQFIGPVSGILSGLTAGRAIFVGADGDLVETPPVPAPGGSIFIQGMGSVIGDSEIILNPSFSLTRIMG